MNNTYGDIINLPHHKSSKHPHMPRLNRAAQFSPFAALTGHDDAVRERARETSKRVELDKYIKEELNEKLSIIDGFIDDKLEVSIRYFQEDDLKEGGSYISTSGYVKKIDEYLDLIVMNSGIKIWIDDIIKIDCDLFDALGYLE